MTALRDVTILILAIILVFCCPFIAVYFVTSLLMDIYAKIAVISANDRDDQRKLAYVSQTFKRNLRNFDNIGED